MYKNKKFLVVDDIPVMRKIVYDNLLLNGYKNVQMAADGEEALSILRRSKIDLLITDIKMPNMSGIELVQAMRNIEKLRQIPVLMFTAETSREIINQALMSGVNEFMVKPFTAAVLYTKIESIFSGHSPMSLIQSAEQSIPVAVSKPVSDKKPELLVVDDLPANIDVMIGILKQNYKVKVATNGAKALEVAASETKPDLILLDIMMLGMDGLEVCRRLKNDPNTESIPVIFLTAKTDEETTIKGFELGAVDYINKPIEPEILKMRVKTQLDLKISRDKLAKELDIQIENIRLREEVERITHHDLKNALSIIFHQAEQISHDKQLTPQCHEIAHKIEQAGTTILNMVNSSINIYKIETDNYQLSAEAIDIENLLTKIQGDFEHKLTEQDIQLKINIDENINTAFGEALLCYSILSNLIKNAIEASEAKDIITVSVAYKVNIIITIHNPAMIPETIQDYFFEKYVTSGKNSGTGLGTYSAKLMTEIQKGELSFRTSEDEGTHLILELPTG